QLLPTGGTVVLSGNASVTQQSSGLPGSQWTTGGGVTVSQPLMRGIAPYGFEPLTQGERDTLYAVRDFELFRQDFAIRVVSGYYNLVNQKIRVANARRSVEGLEFVARRARAFFDTDRLNKI